MEYQFDRLSDCMLLFLLERLDSTSLYQLSQVSPRLEQLILEKSLWKKIDARDEPNDKEKINYILDRVHALTEMLLMKGKKVFPRIIKMLRTNSFKKLTVLALENQVISQHSGAKLSDFPKSLVELSLRNSFFEASSEFFRKGFEAMENLKVLIVDGCTNVSSSVIMSVSKYPNLEIFSCYKCPIENSVAYFSIAVSNGFKKIKVFDVRLSGLGNTFLRAMMRKPNVQVIYFQNKDTSYELDFRNRAAEAFRANLRVPQVQFNELSITGNEENLISDFGTLEFSRTTADYEKQKLPYSFLYTYPYPPCTCGFKERQEQHKLGMETESVNPEIYVRAEERKLIEIIDSGEWMKENTDKGNGKMDESFESSSSTGNGSTEKGQSCDHHENQAASTSSASDGNSLLDAQDINQSRACTEIIYKVYSKKKMYKDQSVGTDSQDVGKKEPKTSSDRSSAQDKPVGLGAGSKSLPSTSGLSAPLRKRKLSNVETRDRKKARRSESSSESSSSEEDEDQKPAVPCSSPHSTTPGGSGSNERVAGHSDENVLCDSKDGDARSPRVLPRNSADRLNQQIESSINNLPEGDRRRGLAVVRCRGVRDAPAAHTQVYPCACGNHSVIVVTADETEDGDAPPLNPPENHFRPQHCEQRINLNAHQSLRVINRNENANARPEIELVEINKDRSLKCGLKQLSFRGYDRVSNLTLRNVENLHLDLLDVTYTNCTKKGILDFLRINPNCRVLHKEFCICKPRMDF